MVKLSFKTFFGYGLGHVFSDLLSHLYFSYFILYATNFIGIKETEAALVLLVSQFFDGIFTPLFGRLCDNLTKSEEHPIFVRKRLHFFGLIILVLCSAFMYLYCLPCQVGNPLFLLIPLAGLIQIGYAAVEVSHLSLVPFLSRSDESRTKMISLAQFNNTIGGVIIYVAVIFLNSRFDSSSGLIPRLYIIVMVLGLPSVTAFQILIQITEEEVDEETEDDETEDSSSVVRTQSNFFSAEGSMLKRSSLGSGELENPEAIKNEKQELEGNISRQNTNLSSVYTRKEALEEDYFVSSCFRSLSSKMCVRTRYTENTETSTLRQWLHDPKLHLTAAIYVFSKLGLLVSQIYTPLMLDDRFGLDSPILGSIPLVQFLSSFLAVSFTPFLIERLGRRRCYVLGMVLVVLAALILNTTIHDKKILSYTVYVFSSCTGLGTMICLINSIGLIAELVNQSTFGAVIYGILGFVAKISTGFILIVSFNVKSLPPSAILGWFPGSALGLAAGCIFKLLGS
eukprot:snap_masked-scaffold_20-processed-gene-5.85-mRNA-1 protein AED:1.00 eAED:1.00 QI:0/-1/0/0/-1/1/1/0/509